MVTPSEEEGAEYTLTSYGMELLASSAETMGGAIAAMLVPLIANMDELHFRAATAENLNGRLVKALAEAHDNWPTTSWGAANEIKDGIRALLAEVEQAGTMEPTTPEETTDAQGPTR